MKRLVKLLAMILAVTVVASSMLGSAAAGSIADCAGKVTCDMLNVRENPDTSSTVLTTVVNGETVVILNKVDSEWYHVNAYGTIGYVASMYIGEVEDAKNFAATGTVSGSDVRMRERPNTDCDVIGTYQDGTEMNVIGINNGWYKVQVDGLTGYIRSDFFNLTGGGSTYSEGREIAEFAKQFVGYPYIYGAQSPDVGFDCSGLNYYVYGKFGYSINRTASQQYLHDGVEVSKSELQPGDLVFFSSNGGYSVTHVGMYIGGGEFVNPSTSKTGVIISSIYSDYYTRVWYGAKRIVN